MGRPRGFAAWNPQPETLDLLAAVKAVLAEYEKHLPLTVRQVFYRLVGQYGYDKTEQAYARLCEHLVKARRAGMIPFASIRDDGTVGQPPQTFTGVDDFWRGVRDDLKHYSRDRQAGQAVRIELWCEAAGMVPQLQRVAFNYSVPVYSTGGFSSVTVTNEIAQRALARDVPTVFMHAGDYDPSGESIFDAMAGDAGEFVEQTTYARDTARPGVADSLAQAMGFDRAADIGDLAELRPERVALTEDQVEHYNLDTAPPKRSDTRSRNWSGTATCQLEAMPPEVLADTINTAIRDHLDIARYREEVELESADEDSIDTTLTRIEDER